MDNLEKIQGLLEKIDKDSIEKIYNETEEKDGVLDIVGKIYNDDDERNNPLREIGDLIFNVVKKKCEGVLFENDNANIYEESSDEEEEKFKFTVPLPLHIQGKLESYFRDYEFDFIIKKISHFDFVYGDCKFLKCSFTINISQFKHIWLRKFLKTFPKFTTTDLDKNFEGRYDLKISEKTSEDKFLFSSNINNDDIFDLNINCKKTYENFVHDEKLPPHDFSNENDEIKFFIREKLFYLFFSNF